MVHTSAERQSGHSAILQTSYYVRSASHADQDSIVSAKPDSRCLVGVAIWMMIGPRLHEYCPSLIPHQDSWCRVARQLPCLQVLGEVWKVARRRSSVGSPATVQKHPLS